MAMNYYSSKSEFHRVSYSDPCWVCQKQGCTYLILNGRRKYFCCRRRDSGRFAKDGRGIFTLPDENARNGLETPPRPIPAPIQRRNTVYQAMLSKLILEDKEKQSLLARGLSEEQIAKLNYRTTKDVAAELDREGYILDRVAGFYREGLDWKANIREGFFVPVHDIRGRISGLQIRTYSETVKYKWFSSYCKVLEDGSRELLPWGASSGAPLNWVQGKGKTLWVTEGILKSQVCGLYMNVPIAGKAGTGAGIKELADASLNYDKIILAYDTDWQNNNNVWRAMVNQYEAIKERSGIPVKVATWSDYKGLDDYLLAGYTKIVVTPFEEIER